MDNPEPRSQYLNVVLRQIARTALRIPRFQREFVWDERDVVELLGSIQKGYPIGSILTWKVESADDYFSGFRTDPFPPADTAMASFEVVLDGAQRLSSLYGCLRNAESNPIYQVSFDLRTQTFIHATQASADQAWLVPMETLFDSRRFLAIQSRISELDESEELLPRALDLYSTFQDYQIPIIAISHAVLEDVVEVFRRVNSSGTPLSSVDFVRALTWQSSFDLQETFDAFAEQFHATPLEGFTEDFLIRCLSISAGLSLDSRDVRQLKTLSDRPQGLTGEIDQMEGALLRLADFLSSLRVRGIHEVPYDVQRLLLFSMMLYDVQIDHSQLRDWFWQSTFAEEHQSKPESYVTRLVREMRDGNPFAALEVRKPIDPALFATRVRRSGSAVATGFDLLLRNMGSRSLISGDLISQTDSMHGLLFTRYDLESDAFITTSLHNRLANGVVLSLEDAGEWRKLRRDHRLIDAFDLCQAQTGEAEAIWMSQGIDRNWVGTASQVLELRSSELLRSVVDLPQTS